MGWLELWRSDPALERCLDAHHETLRSYLSVLTQGQLEPSAVNALLAISEGLQSRMAAPVHPLAPDEADLLLSRMLASLQVPVAPVPRGAPVPSQLRAAVNWMRHAGRGEAWRADPDLIEAFRTERPA